MDNLKDNKQILDIYCKKDIMNIFKCESAKALRIMKLMYQTSDAIKIGKEYYVYKQDLLDFIDRYRGKEIYI